MTNFEYWKDRILEIRADGDIAVVDEKPERCLYAKCKDCLFSPSVKCAEKLFNWLYSEHKEKPKLTKRERKLCEALETGWIAADKSGRVFWFDSLPMKGEYSHVIKRGNCLCMSDAGFYFEFMDFEDEEPWMVENLLLLEVEE